MATLTETAFYTRKGLKIFAGAVVVIIVLRFAWSVVVGLWVTIFPPPPVPPTLAFDVLPRPIFPETKFKNTQELKYRLETITGKLPVFPSAMKVYFMPKTGSSFGKDDQMRSLAGQLGFLENPKEIGGKENNWLFNDKSNPLKFLEYDGINSTFKMVYDFKSDLNVFVRGGFPNKDAAVSKAIDFYSNLGLLRQDVNTADPKVSYYKLDGTNLTATTSLFEADAIGVSFSRAGILEEKLKYSVVNDDLEETPVSIMLVASSDENKSILEANYYYQEVSYANWATYPPISSEDAFSQLEAGKAYVVSMPQNFSGQEIAIRQIYLAYYDSFIPQSYFQPVVVFSDEQGFMAYYPAIALQYLQEQNLQTPSQE